jgi:hypothetical protein
MDENIFKEDLSYLARKELHSLRYDNSFAKSSLHLYQEDINHKINLDSAIFEFENFDVPHISSDDMMKLEIFSNSNNHSNNDAETDGLNINIDRKNKIH